MPSATATIEDDPWTMTVQIAGEIDEPEVRRALGLLVDPAHCVQVQSLPSARWRHIPGRDTEALVAAVRELSDEKGVYASLNPFKGPLPKAVTSGGILSRRWFLIDADAIKPGEVGTSTTDAEKEEARVVTEAVRDHLRGLGWPEPVFVDSGNNYQLLYRVELANDRIAQQLLRLALKALGARFGTPGVKIDPGVHDARRICKIPGTWVRKGPNTPDRPWRMARIVSAPAAVEVVPVELIRALAGVNDGDGAEPPPAPAPAPADPWRMTVGGSDQSSYARSALEREVGRVATATQPGRNEVLYDAALKLGTLVGAGHLESADVWRKLEAAGRACGLGGDGDPREIERAIANGFKVGLENPRQVPAWQGPAGKGPAPAPLDPSELLVVRASTVEPKTIRWLWECRIPKGFITVFAGRTGLGKSFVTCDITSRVTAGLDWPDSHGECIDPANVLLISEDPFEYVLTPRLMEMGADLSRVFYLSWEAMAKYDLANTAMLEQAYVQAGSPVLIVIDPPTNFLNGRDEHKNSEVRALLMHLVVWFNGRDCACILITHVNKQTGKGSEALSRVIGSVAWTTTSRVAHAFVTDPGHPDRVIFVPMKSNLGALPKGLAYRIRKTESLARVEWLGAVDTSADDAMGGEKPQRSKEEKAEDAAEWLLARFAERAEWSSEDILAAGSAAGFSRNLMFEAKKKIGAVARGGNKAPWRWMLNKNGDTHTQSNGHPF